MTGDVSDRAHGVDLSGGGVERKFCKFYQQRWEFSGQRFSCPPPDLPLSHAFCSCRTVPKRTCATTMCQSRCSAVCSAGTTMHGPGEYPNKSVHTSDCVVGSHFRASPAPNKIPSDFEFSLHPPPRNADFEIPLQKNTEWIGTQFSSHFRQDPQFLIKAKNLEKTEQKQKET